MPKNPREIIFKINETIKKAEQGAQTTYSPLSGPQGESEKPTPSPWPIPPIQPPAPGPKTQG